MDTISLFQPFELCDISAIIDTHDLSCSNNDATSTRGFRKSASRHTYYRLLIFILHATFTFSLAVFGMVLVLVGFIMSR